MDLPETDDRLTSWKEVAAFLGRTVRTVQRWERSHGLPLRRGGPGQRGAVVASKREISAWWEHRRSVLQGEGPANGIFARDDAESLDRPFDRPTRPPGAAPGGWRVVAIYLALAGLATALSLTVPALRPAGATGKDAPKVGRLLATSTSEGRTISHLPLNAAPSRLVLSASGDLAYVALHDEAAVAVVDLVARRVIDRFEAPERPTRLALSADGTRLLIKGSSDLGVFDLRQRTLTRFSVGDGLAVDMHPSRDGRHVWVTLAQAGLKVLDIETGRWETIPTIGCPMFLAPAPRTRRVFLSYQCGGPGGRYGHDALEIIDEIRRTSILSRAGPPLVGSALAVSPDEEHLWVDTSDACESPAYDRLGCPAGSGPVLHVLRARTLDTLLTVRVPRGGFQTTPAFFPDGTRLVLVGAGLSVIDRGLGTLLESIDVEPSAGQFTPDGRRFISLDSANRRLLEFEVSPLPDAAALREVVTHWSGDGTTSDIVGGTHGLTADGVRFEPGRYGLAFAFDGASRGVSFGRRLNLEIALDDGGYAAWVKPRRTGVPLHIASRTGPAGWNWTITSEGRLAFCLVSEQGSLSCDTGGLVGETTLRPDRWYHVAVVRSGSVLTLFVDARQDGARSIPDGFQPPAPSWNEAVLRLGAGPEGSAPFHGLIDEVLLFRRALSGEDLARVMRATWLDAR